MQRFRTFLKEMAAVNVADLDTEFLKRAQKVTSFNLQTKDFESLKYKSEIQHLFHMHFFPKFDLDNTLKGDITLQYSGKIYEYVSFVLQVFTALGICVQIPFYLHVLRINLDRRVFVVLSFIIAALISPPDVISQVTLALPLIGLNEMGLFVSRWQTRVNELRT